MPSAEVETGGDQEEERQCFQKAREVLRPATPADAEPLDDGEDGDDRKRGRLDAAEFGKEHERVFADDDGDGGRRTAGRDPVAPADDKAGVITESATYEDVLPARLRHASVPNSASALAPRSA